MAGLSDFLADLAIAFMTGFAAAIIPGLKNRWAAALFAIAFWGGVLFAKCTAPSMGDTIHEFIVTIAVLNCIPILSTVGVLLGFEWLRYHPSGIWTRWPLIAFRARRSPRTTTLVS